MSNLTSIAALAPSTLVAGSPRGARTWHEHRGLAGFAGRTGAVSVQHSTHNSMPMGATPVNPFDAGRRVCATKFYAAKQAAPPRGRYR